MTDPPSLKPRNTLLFLFSEYMQYTVYIINKVDWYFIFDYLEEDLFVLTLPVLYEKYEDQVDFL